MVLCSLIYFFLEKCTNSTFCITTSSSSTNFTNSRSYSPCKYHSHDSQTSRFPPYLMYYQQPRDSATSELHASHAKPNSWADNHLQIRGSLKSIIETRSFNSQDIRPGRQQAFSDQQPLRTRSSEGNNKNFLCDGLCCTAMN